VSKTFFKAVTFLLLWTQLALASGGTMLLHVRGDQTLGTTGFNAFYAAGDPYGVMENPNSGSNVTHANNSGGYGSGNNVYSFTSTWAWLIYQGWRNLDFTSTSGAFTVGARIIPRFTGFPACSNISILDMGSNSTGINGAKIEWVQSTGKVAVTWGDRLGFGGSAFTFSSTNTYSAALNTPLEVCLTDDGLGNASSKKLYVNRVADGVSVSNRSAQANHPLTTLMIGRDLRGLDPCQNFDLVEAWVYQGVDSVCTDSRSTFLTSSNVDGSSNTSPGVGNVLSGITWLLNGITQTGTFAAPSASIIKTGIVYDGVTGTYDGSDRWTTPSAGDLRSGIQLKSNSTTLNFTGTLTVPSLANTKIGVAGDGGTGTYDGSDRYSDPGILNVRSGTTYMFNSTSSNRTGLLDLPLTANVLTGVTYDSATKTGTYACPSTSCPAANCLTLPQAIGLGL
jgi:hypothetical protein